MRENSVTKEIVRDLGIFIWLGVYCIVPTLVMTVIMNCNKWFLNYPELAESIVDLFVFLSTLFILLRVKGRFGTFTLKSFGQGFVCSLPLLLFYAYFTAEAVKWIFFDHPALYTPQFRTAFWIQLFYCITVGMMEETVFRCGFLNYLLGKNQRPTKKREVFACIYSAFLFGIVHFMNYFVVPDISLETVVYTALGGCVLGYIYAVLYLKTKNLAVVMFLHFAWDFTAYCNAKMIVEKYRYGGHYNFMLYQGPVLLVMVIIVSVLLYKSTAEELSLHTVSENGKEGVGV